MILTAALGSCASAGKARVPSWVLSPPVADSTDTWFTGSASAPSGNDISELDEKATADLVASVMRYIGAKVSVDSNAVARATADGLALDITQSVKTEANNRVAGFKVRDRYVSRDKSTGRVTVWILASYRSADIEKEKQRISALFAERDDAVSVPEAEGDSLRKSGRYWEAVDRFVAAARAAAGPGIENADVKVARNLDKAQALVSGMRLSLSAPLMPAVAGSPYAGPFVIKVESGAAARAAEIPLLASYPRKQGTRIGQRSVSIATDSAGMALWNPPPPDFVGSAKVSVRVDFSLVSKILDGMPSVWAERADPLRQAIAALATDVAVDIRSPSAGSQIVTFLVDLDQSGQVRPGQRGQQALEEALSRVGLLVKTLRVDPSAESLANQDGLRAAALAIAPDAPSLAFGTVTVLDVRKDGSTWIADARVEAKLLQLATGSLLWSGSRSAAAVGVDQQAAIDAAIREACGNAFATEVLAAMPN